MNARLSFCSYNRQRVAQAYNKKLSSAEKQRQNAFSGQRFLNQNV